MLKTSCFSIEAGIIFWSGYKPFFLKWIVSFFSCSFLAWPRDLASWFFYGWKHASSNRQWLLTVYAHQKLQCLHNHSEQFGYTSWSAREISITYLIVYFHHMSSYFVIMYHHIWYIIIHFTNMTYKTDIIFLTRFNYSHFRKIKIMLVYSRDKSHIKNKLYQNLFDAEKVNFCPGFYICLLVSIQVLYTLGHVSLERNK